MPIWDSILGSALNSACCPLGCSAQSLLGLNLEGRTKGCPHLEAGTQSLSLSQGWPMGIGPDDPGLTIVACTHIEPPLETLVPSWNPDFNEVVAEHWTLPQRGSAHASNSIL